MINVDQFKNEIINPSINSIGVYSDDVVDLLLGTCLQESMLGTYVRKVNGSALGIYQMKSDTYDDIVFNYLNTKCDLYFHIVDLLGRREMPIAEDMIFDLRLSTIMCRLHYLRVKEKLPKSGDVENMAKYWKKYYNTEKGSGTIKSYIDKYNRYVVDKN